MIEGKNVLRLLRSLLRSLRTFGHLLVVPHLDPELAGRSVGFVFLVKFFRVPVLAFRGFIEDKCLLRAGALTFSSMMSIVPVLALAFAMAKGFGLQGILEEFVYQNLEGQEEIADKLIEFSKAALENARGGLIAGFGILVLLWALISVLGNMEHAFNNIWGTRKHRAISRKFTDYVSIALIFPLVAGLQTTANALLVSDAVQKKFVHLGLVGAYMQSLLKLAPGVFLCIAVSFIYVYLPNTKVKLVSGLLGGTLGGTLWIMTQKLYLHFQIGVSRNSAIYGTLAALPLFLLWLHISWLLILFGAEITYAFQNVDAYRPVKFMPKISMRFRGLVALRAFHAIGKRFLAGERPYSREELARELLLPEAVIDSILASMVRQHLLIRVVNGAKGYLPARPLKQIRIKSVLDALNAEGRDVFTLREDEIMAELNRRVGAIEAHALAAKENEDFETLLEAEGVSEASSSPSSPLERSRFASHPPE